MQETKTRSTKEQWGEQGSQKCRTAGSERHLGPEVLEEWFNQTLSSATWRRGRHRGSPDGPRDPDFDDRLYRCWRLQTCGSCLSSDARCGWCPYVSPYLHDTVSSYRKANQQEPISRPPASRFLRHRICHYAGRRSRRSITPTSVRSTPSALSCGQSRSGAKAATSPRLLYSRPLFPPFVELLLSLWC